MIMKEKHLNTALQETDAQAAQGTSHLWSGIIMITVAILMAIVPTALAMNHILNISSPNVIFGMAVWYIFAICAIIMGTTFIRRGLVQGVPAQGTLG